jgi:methylated-DNA-[protein]-cysteine S-methyltransferase
MTPLAPPTGSPPPELVDRLVARAADAGLLDVAYVSVDSPLGPLLLATTPRGLVTVSYTDFRGGEEAVLEDLAARLSPRILEAPARLDPVRRELDEYFSGRRERFDVPVDLALARGFGRRILEATVAIPFGEVRSYRDVATVAGNAKATRAAGNALGHNPIPIVVPCHRVLRTGGALGGYTGGTEKKETLLRIEGVLL